MPAESLFTLTKDHLDTGLRGVPVGTCPTSMVDPVKGLSYRGYPVESLAEKSPEEVIYLLFHSELPSAQQVEEFSNTLLENSNLNPKVLDHFRNLPQSGHPMKWFISGINAMGMHDNKRDYRMDALRVVAQLPEMVAGMFRIRNGWGDPIASKPELGYMENFTQMLGVPGASPHLEQLMRVFNILHYDHGGGNLSTFVGKAVASGQEDIYGSLVSSMCALAGPLHGMANQECFRFLKKILEVIKDPSDEKALMTFLESHFSSGGKIYGFGHAVLRVEDPRASVEYALGEKVAGADPLFRLAVTLRKVGTELLKKKDKISDPYPNVDAVSGSLLNACGLKDEDYYTVLFGLSRCVGISAQIVFERTEARGGKGTPIVRPRYIYTGPVRS